MTQAQHHIRRLSRRPPVLWTDWAGQVAEALGSLSVLDQAVGRLEADEGFRRLLLRSHDLRPGRNALYLIGNGASASLASHAAVDLMKRGRYQTMVFTDPALITATANDASYAEAFAEPLGICLRDGDMLAAISSSGESDNILRACRLARQRGVFVVTFSAMSPENSLRRCGDLNFYVKAATYGLAESCHAAILHHWIDLTEISSRPVTEMAKAGEAR